MPRLSAESNAATLAARRKSRRPGFFIASLYHRDDPSRKI
jgi:hypothetical protein